MLVNKKKVLVVGGRGNIGSSIIDELIDNKYQIYSTSTSKFDSIPVNDSLILINEITLDKVENCIAEIEMVDAVIFSQGINDKSPVKFLSTEKLSEVFSANFNYTVEFMRCLLKAKKLNKEASIVFISSISAIHYSVSNAAYSASKAALEAYANTLVLELAPQRIRVNIIRPGLLEGKMKDAYALDDSMNDFIQKIPLKRLGTAQDVANLTMFLLSDKSSWMTGSTIDLDGGIKFI
jgi:NAD(P)-dependent dehydrogenase (short-subunit alcohol dehydrogenase family)